jgi:hypothetical protein
MMMWKVRTAMWMLADVEGLHVERNYLVGCSYLVIIDMIKNCML